MFTMHDVVAVGLPEFITVDVLRDPEILELVISKLDERAWEEVSTLWPQDQGPHEIANGRIEWYMTDRAEAVDVFQPVHNCEECRLGNAKAREFLATNPGCVVALGNVSYVPVWH